ITVNINSAYEDAQNLISTEPTWWVGYHLIGQVHQYKKEYQEAINWCDRALERNPNAKEAKLFKDVLWRKKRRNLERRGFGLSGKSLIEAMNEGLRSPDPTKRANASLIKAKLHQVGEDLPLDRKTAFKIYLELAEQGVIEAYVDLGIAYLHPDEKGVEPDVEKGIHWIEKSANAGVAHGLFCLGRLYENGLGKPQNHCKAMELNLEASQKGHGGASYNIGFSYLNGIGICKDEERTKQYFTLAAIREMPCAMDHLAWMYLKEGHIGLALSWYNQAVEYGNVDAILEKTKFTEAASLQCRINIGGMLQQYGISGDCENKTYRLEIVKRSSQGLLFAKELLNAMDLFLEGWAAMRSDPDRALELFADCIRKSEIVPVFTEMQEFQLGLLCSTITREPILDVSIRICAVRLMGNERNDDPLLFPYLNDCMKCYAEEKFFVEVLAKLLASTGKSKESFETYVNALERFPFDPTLLSGKMTVMKDLIGTKVSFDDVLETCNLFIQKAHADDNMVGIQRRTLLWRLWKYSIKTTWLKDTVERRLKEEYILGGLINSDNKESVSDPIEDSKRCSRAAGPIRFEITLEHRKAYRDFYGRILSGEIYSDQSGYFNQLCFEPMHHQEQCTSKKFKEITIREMYPHGDKIHEGRILHVQIVEKSWNFAGKWFSVVKDKHHDCIHMTFEDFPDAWTKLWLGSTLSIKNPYYRLACEGERRAIRVDDPATIKFGDSVTLCNFCWAPDAEILCDHCMAAYCDNECQKKDMKLLKYHFMCEECEYSFVISDWESTETE
ncbi:unnamed protein product, partial [Allacma fusca]